MAAASSSSFHESHKTYEQTPEEIQGVEGDWLDLGLRLGSLTPLCKKQENGQNQQVSPYFKGTPETCLELGLGGSIGKEKRKVVELDNEVVRSGSDHVWPMSNDYHNMVGLMLSDDHSHNNNHHGGFCLPSSSISRAKWKINNHPDVSHDYPFGGRLRPHQPGLWFTLRSSSTNHQGESLPQIEKAFIRVKDENMTVFMVKRYLVRKLGLSSETEIDISCMGQNLEHSQTLKQVRDAVWFPRLEESVTSSDVPMQSPNDPSVNHIMPLQYGRRCSY